MTDNTQENKKNFSKIINRNKKPILIRNKFFTLQKGDSSKNINDQISLENKSELINANSILKLSDITKKEKIIINQKYSPKNDKKYSNETLFGNRLSKGLIFLNKMNEKNARKSLFLNLQKTIFNKNLTLLNQRNSSFLFTKKYSPRKIKFFSVDKKIKNNSIKQVLSPFKTIKNPKHHYQMYFPRLAKRNNIFTPKLSSKSIDADIIKEKEEKEREKNTINENLLNLLDKIKQRISPKRKLIFEKDKLPNINKIKKVKSCIHKEQNFKGKIEFIKTHLDGFTKTNDAYKNRYKSEKRFQINEGYIDLDVLGDGDNMSFKTDLIERHGVIYYEFSKNGRMETIEGKFHKVHKDKAQFKKLLQKYNQNEILKEIQDKDFQYIKKNYGIDSIAINQNVYKDLYHMIFKNKDNILEIKKPD